MIVSNSKVHVRPIHAQALTVTYHFSMFLRKNFWRIKKLSAKIFVFVLFIFFETFATGFCCVAPCSNATDAPNQVPGHNLDNRFPVDLRSNWEK